MRERLEEVAARKERGEKIEIPDSEKPSREDVERALAQLDPEDLAAEAEKVLDCINNAIEAPFDKEALEAMEAEVIDGLLFRQRWHRVLRGAQFFHPDVEYSAEQQQAVEYFDRVIRPLAWGLAFTNHLRDGHYRLIEDRKAREEAWWWWDGLDVPWEAIQCIEDVADLAEMYPTFNRRLTEARRAARLRQEGRFVQGDLPKEVVLKC